MGRCWSCSYCGCFLLCKPTCRPSCKPTCRFLQLLPQLIQRKLQQDAFFRHSVWLFVVTFFILLPIPCHRLRYSIYYHHPSNLKYAQQQMRHENEGRLRVAEQYIKMINQSKLHGMLDKVAFNESGIDIAVTVISVSRNRHKVDAYEPKYLTQVVWRLLSLLHRQQSQGFPHKVKLSVCNVDSDPASYEEAHQLSSVIPVFNRFNKLSLPLGHVLEKEKEDYVYCMNASLLSSPRYVLLIEDDALPNEDFFSVLDYMLRLHLDWRKLGDSHMPNSEDVIYVKLYHPERLLGYINTERDRLTELIGIGLFFGPLAAAIYMRIYGTSEAASWKVVLMFSVYFMLIALSVGRSHMIQLRQLFSPYLYTYVRAPECCTPAMLFPKYGAHRVIEYLNKTKCGKNFGKDMALEHFRNTENLATYMVQPNLVTHIGMYSSLRHNLLDPFIV